MLALDISPFKFSVNSNGAEYKDDNIHLNNDLVSSFSNKDG